MPSVYDDAVIRRELAGLAHGELRPQSGETIMTGLYGKLYLASSVTNVHFHDVVVLGEINVWGQNVTGRIFTYHGCVVRVGNNTLTVTQCTAEQLRARVFGPQ